MLVCSGLNKVCFLFIYTINCYSDLAVCMFEIWCHHEGISGIEWTKTEVYSDCVKGGISVKCNEFRLMFGVSGEGVCLCCEWLCMRLCLSLHESSYDSPGESAHQ